MRAIFSAMGWLTGIVASLVAAQPATTLTGILTGMLGHVAHVLAFLLPLKVILLAGAEGIPRYFAPFIEADQKGLAVVILSAGAALCYVLSLFLDTVLKVLSARGGAQILRTSNALHIVENQNDEAGRLFLQFAQLASNLLFVLVVLAFLYLINAILVGCILAAVVLSMLYFGLSADRAAPASRRDIGATLKVIASLTFFGCFGLLLLPFVVSAPDASVLTAIISFVLLRQLLSVLPRMARMGKQLAAQKDLVSALFFRHHRFRPRERGVGQKLKDTLERETHIGRLRAQLGTEIGPGSELDLVWVDTASRDFETFEIYVRDPRTSERSLYLERLLAPGRKTLAENEAFLFDHIPPDALGAPRPVTRFVEGRFDCIVSRIGLVRPGTVPDRGEAYDLLERHWATDPGPNLIRAYRASHLLLHERLTVELVSRVTVALDHKGEQQNFDEFAEALPRLRERLGEMPLYVYNPNVDESRFYKCADGEIVLPSWGRWSLEPIGAVLPEGPPEDLARRLVRVKAARDSIPVEVDVDDLMLVNRAFQLERLIGKTMLKRSLEVMDQILSSPGLSGPPRKTAPRQAAVNLVKWRRTSI